MVTVTGLPDNSVEAVRYELHFLRGEDSLFRFADGSWSQRYQPGAVTTIDSYPSHASDGGSISADRGRGAGAPHRAFGATYLRGLFSCCKRRSARDPPAAGRALPEGFDLHGELPVVVGQRGPGIVLAARARMLGVRDDDPGWPVSPRLLLSLIPGIGLAFHLRGRGTKQRDGLVTLREIFISFSVAIVLIGVWMAFLYPSTRSDGDPQVGLALGLAGAGALSVLGGSWGEHPLDCADERRLAGSYRTRFFLRVAFSEAAALFGFVGFFLADTWWSYPVGASITALGFARAAPTAAKLRRDQQRLAEKGCCQSLVRALRTVPLDGHRPSPTQG